MLRHAHCAPVAPVLSAVERTRQKMTVKAAWFLTDKGPYPRRFRRGITEALRRVQGADRNVCCN